MDWNREIVFGDPPPGLKTRLSAVGLAVLFVALSLALRIGLWKGLGCLLGSGLWLDGIISAISLAAVLCATRWLARRRPDWLPETLDIQPRRWRVGPFLRGAFWGALLFAAVWAFAFAGGGLSQTLRPQTTGALLGAAGLALLLTLLGAAWEEWTFRGWPFAVAARMTNPHAVAWLLGIAFGLAHMVNPDASTPAIVSVSLAGILLSYALLSSGSILFVIGLHTAWNFTQTLLTSSRFWEVQWADNLLLNGGPWGLEASLPGLAVTAMAAFGFYLRTLYVTGRRRRRSRY